MPDSFTVTSSQSWFSRVVGSIGRVFVGILLVLVAFPLLWWNEGRAVKTARGLSEGASAVVQVPADHVDAAHDGKLVYLTGQATVSGTVTDPEFAVSANAIKLVRTVEMFQWQEKQKSEKRKKLGGGEETTTTYTYETAWESHAIDSSSFKQPAGHTNPGALPWNSRTFTAGTVTLGAFTLSPAVLALIDQREDRRIDDGDARSLPQGVDVTVSDGAFYKSRTPQSPQVGDVRISYQVVKPLVVSLVAVQQGTSFEAFHATSGTSVLLLQPGVVSAAQMFKAAAAENTMWTWILRGAGFLLMLIGVALVLGPLAVVGSVIPFLGTLLSAGIGVVAFLIALGLSLVTIALAWFVYRPLLSLALLAVAAGALILVLMRHRGAKAAGQPAGAAP
jgi:hypothetical protein